MLVQIGQRRRAVTSCRALGRTPLTIRQGRHTIVGHALAGGRPLPEVRDAAGHSNVAVTSAYLHVLSARAKRT